MSGGGGAVVKRSAAIQRVSTLASKIKANYANQKQLERASPSAVQERSNPAAESRSDKPPATRKLMDKLADEIHDSLTKLFTKKQGAAKPTTSKYVDNKPDTKKHPAENIKSNVFCYKCGRRGHSISECILPDGKGKRCYNCLKVATHLAKDCRKAPTTMAEAVRNTRGSRGRSIGRPRSPPPSRLRSLSRSLSPPSPLPLRSGRPTARGTLFRFSSRGRSKNSSLGVPTCRVCGNRGHPSHECTKRKSACHVCGKTGHLAAVCRFRL